MQYKDEYMPMDHAPFAQENVSFRDEAPFVDRVWHVSIMHSGTHFAWEHLKVMGYTYCDVYWDTMKLRHPVGPYQFVHSHIGIGSQVHRIHTSRVILNLRNPIDVFKSHVYRYRWDNDDFLPHIVKAFKDWDYVHGMFDCYIFRVDAEDQQKEVQMLGDWLGAKSWTYKQQPRNVKTALHRPPTVQHGFLPAQASLYASPPPEIFELATQYGY